MSRADEEAGAREPFEDAALYDFEYRRRRADVAFYRRLAADRMAGFAPGPILDLACGTGRLLVPLLRDGHTVVGMDLSPAMLARARARVERLRPSRWLRALLFRSDLRRFAVRPRFALAIAAFHSFQHLVSDGDLLRCLAAVRRGLLPDGWLAFDILPATPAWTDVDPTRRWGRTVFRHPTTRERVVYTSSRRYDARRRVLHMTIHYQPIDHRGGAAGPETSVRLCHRQFAPGEVEQLLVRAGFRILATFADFDGRPLGESAEGRGSHVRDPATAEHIFVARRAGFPDESAPRHRRDFA